MPSPQQPARSHSPLKGVARTCLLSALLLGQSLAPTVSARDNASTTTIAWEALPKQAQETYHLILRAGPFPYEKDGTTFFNRERILPAEKRGYYREYTVRTPRARNRGARRIVCGGLQPQTPDRCYYTADHYSSFRLMTALPTSIP